MGKNIRRITKQKWYGAKTEELKINFDKKIEFKNQRNAIIDEKSLIKAYLEKNKNKEGKSQLFNFSNAKGKETKIFKELKKHESECLNKNKEFIKFSQDNTQENVEEIYVKYDHKNIVKINVKKNKEKNKVACIVKDINEEDKDKIKKKNEYFKKINKIIIKFLKNSKKKYQEQLNDFSYFDIIECIESFDGEYYKYIKDKEYLKDIIDYEQLYKNNKKTKQNKNLKGNEEKIQLNKYLIDKINNKNLNLKDYYIDFYDFFYTFFNKKYELNKTLNCKDSKYDTQKAQDKNLKKRIYRYDENNRKREINLNKHYQNEIKEKRMKLLIGLEEEKINDLLNKIYEVYDLEQLQEKIKSAFQMELKDNSNKKIDKINSDKIIRIYKNYYIDEISTNFKEKKLKSYTAGIEKKEQENEVKLFLMRLFNEYMKGRYIKARNSAQKNQLTHKYLLDIYNPEKIKEKFKVSLNHKINLYKLNDCREIEISKNSLSKQKNKILQTYFLKLIGKIDYCSKVPLNNDFRTGDIFSINRMENPEENQGKTIRFTEKEFIFNKKEQKQFYFLEYFPNPKQYLKDEVKYKNKFVETLNELVKLRDEILHGKNDIDKLLNIEINGVNDDIKYLNDKKKILILEKFRSNNLHKYFDLNQINEIYQKIIPQKSGKIELDLNYYNIYLPKFDKVYNQMIKELHDNQKEKIAFGEDEIKILLSQEKDSNILEKKQAMKYLLQTFYYFGFSHKQEYNDINLEEYVIENQRKSSIKGNSKKENIELIKLVSKNFQEYLKFNKIKDIKINIEQSNIQQSNVELLLNNINLKETQYTNKNVLFVLSYYLDTKQLSQLIHDTKKLVQTLNDLNICNENEKEILIKNIDMMNLNLMYKDKVKNINYINEEKVKEEIKVLFNIDEKENEQEYAELIKIFENKKELYEKTLNKLIDDKAYKNYKDVKYNKDGKEQQLYIEGGELIIHSGIELFLKYNLSEFFEKMNKKIDIKVKKEDVNEYEKYNIDNIDNIENIEKQSNNFINEFNKEIKGTQSVEYKKVLANKYKNQEDYKEIKKLNKEKQKYHYLKNKLNFNLYNNINSFIDEVLARLNGIMMYWERDANIIIEQYERDNDINNNKYAIDRYKKYNDFDKDMFENLINMNISGKYKDITYDENVKALLEELEKQKISKDITYDKNVITAIHIRNYLSHNNYYNYEKDDFNKKLSLLDLINIVHDIMSYNLKYQKDVLNIFNKILNKYRIGNENSKKNERPLKYNDKDKKIIINENYFKPRKHNYFEEIELVSKEYCNIIKEVLLYKEEK